MVRRVPLVGIGVASGLAALSLGTVCSAPGAAPGNRLTIAAYSVAREVLHEALLPAFARHWEQATGRTVQFEESYNGSGAQVRAVLSGFDADVVILALESDVDKLVKAGFVQSAWNAGPSHGMISRSLVVIGLRAGNPKQIQGWSDLGRPGVAVLYPDPKTSGGARWNIDAMYGAALLPGGPRGPRDSRAASALLARVQANVIAMDASGRQSMATFLRGTGDAIVSYENELRLLHREAGSDVPYVIPPATLLIEGPAALVEPSVRQHGNRVLAEAFLAFLRTPEAQRILADYGFRTLDPALDAGDAPPLPPRLFTIRDLGGFPTIDRELYGRGAIWDSLFTSSPGRP